MRSKLRFICSCPEMWAVPFGERCAGCGDSYRSTAALTAARIGRIRGSRTAANRAFFRGFFRGARARRSKAQ